MTNPPDPHTMKFLQAIDAFMESSPRLPDGAADQLKQLGHHLRGYEQEQTPGQKEAQKAHAPTDGTGAPYQKAATGEDVPSAGQHEHTSPGQREFLEAAQRMMGEAQSALPDNSN